MPIRAILRNALAGGPRRKKGFTLVEVVIATGIVLFAFLVIFSLLPLGLNAVQETNRIMVETEIYGAMGSELTSTPFADLENFVQERFPVYFDAQGFEMSTATGAPYIVRCVLHPENDPDLEDGLRGHLRRATLLVGFNRDPDGISESDPLYKTLGKRTFLLVDKGADN